MEHNKLLVGCSFLFLIGLLFALKIVPPNEMFGLHTHWSLSNPEAWLRAHTFAGWAFVAASLIGVAIARVRPDWAESSGILILVAVALAAVAATFLYLSLSV